VPMTFHNSTQYHTSHPEQLFVRQIQPDLEQLEPNMEDIEDSDSSKDEVQLGRLHFSMDYDFSKAEVL